MVSSYLRHPCSPYHGDVRGVGENYRGAGRTVVANLPKVNPIDVEVEGRTHLRRAEQQAVVVTMTTMIQKKKQRTIDG